MLVIFRNHLHTRDRDPGGQAFVIFTITAVLLLGLLVWRTVGKTLSPIRDLAKQADAAGAEHPGVRLVAPSDDDEMQELVHTLNGLLERIERAGEEKSQFYAAASHELRTPLQALSGHLEVALSQPRSAEELGATLAEAHAQTQRLSALVEGVLLLHQLQGIPSKGDQTVDLEATVVREIDNLRPLAEARRVTIHSRLEKATTRAHPTHPDILARNLIENAVKYSPEGATVVVILQPERLTVQNPAQDFDEAWLAKPFARREDSRTAKTGGTGLGLAICRAVARANGWILRFEHKGGHLSATADF